MMYMSALKRLVWPGSSRLAPIIGKCRPAAQRRMVHVTSFKEENLQKRAEMSYQVLPPEKFQESADFLMHLTSFKEESLQKRAEISYQVLPPEKFLESADFLIDNFDDPICKCLNYDLSTLQGMGHMSHGIINYMKSGLSWRAIDKTTGKLVGVCVNRNHIFAESLDTPATYEELIEMGFSKELALGMLVESSMLDHKQVMSAYQETKMMELKILSCSNSYRGMGISSKLIEQSLAHAVSLGYSLSCIVASSLFSQKIAEKFGFEKVKELEYASYVDPVTNTYLLKNVEEPHKSIISYVKKL